MSKKLVIAEKKSVAEHIAKALGISMSEGNGLGESLYPASRAAKVPLLSRQ